MSSPSDDRLEEIIAAYLDAASRGKAPTREELLRQHPEFAGPLGRFLDNERWLREVGAPLDSTGESPPTLASEAVGPAAPVRVRYVGDYELLEELARGAMGVVYRARQSSLNRIVAVKMILAGQLASPDQVRRFQAEAEAAANLDHPHIVPVYEVGEHDGQQYYSMKLIEGQSLAAATGGLAGRPRDVAALLAKAARAVHHAHQRGVLHRDLKPANILLDPSGEPHVADFGLARRGDGSASASGQIVGTPAYMAPEQARAQKGLTTAADVYSLGAILYECLAGRPPFAGADALEVLAAVVAQEPAHPCRVRPGADADLAVIALKCLSKAPERRYESAAALADDLERWLRGEPILARPAGRAERAWRWCRRNPAVAALTSAVVGVLLAATAVSTALAVWALSSAKDALEQKKEADEQRDTAEWLVYASKLSLAQEAWRGGDAMVAFERLGECKPSLRGWEHRHLWTRFTSNQQTLRGHDGQVNGVSWSPDPGEARLASGGSDGTVKVWDADTGKEQLTLKGHAGEVTSVAWFSIWIAGGGSNGTVKVWDQWGKSSRTLKGHRGKVTGLSWSPDGKHLASGSTDKTVKVWDVTKGREEFTLTGHLAGVTCVAWSPDGKHIASGTEYHDIKAGDLAQKVLKIWDARTGQLKLTLKGPAHTVYSVAWSPDGKRLASTCLDGAVQVWDPETGKELLSFKAYGKVSSVAWSPDGTRLAGGGDTVTVWDAKTGKPERTLKGHTSSVTAVAWHAGGNQLASASWDGTVKVWDAQKDQEVLTLKGHDFHVQGVSWSPDGKRLVSGGLDLWPRVWDPLTGEEVRAVTEQSGMLFGVAWHPDGTRIAGGGQDGIVKVWDAKTGQRKLSVKGHTDIVLTVAWSPDGTRLASGGHDNLAKVWDARTGELQLTLAGHRDRANAVNGVKCVAWSPDGERLASTSTDGTVKVWDARTGQPLLDIQAHSADGMHESAVAWSPDGRRLASGGDDFGVNVWDARTGQRKLSLVGHTGVVTSVSWSPDGERLASGGTDGTVRVWDARKGREAITLRGHTFLVHCVAWSPDGTRLASASGDETVRVWDGSRAMSAP